MIPDKYLWSELLKIMDNNGFSEKLGNLENSASRAAHGSSDILIAEICHMELLKMNELNSKDAN